MGSRPTSLYLEEPGKVTQPNQDYFFPLSISPSIRKGKERDIE